MNAVHADIVMLHIEAQKIVQIPFKHQSKENAQQRNARSSLRVKRILSPEAIPGILADRRIY
jgi:hypothetical protein